MTDLQRTTDHHVARMGHEGAIASFHDDVSGLRIEVHRPETSPERWLEYLHKGADRYGDHGLAHVIDLDALADGGGATVFFVAVDGAGHVVGGIRCHGPLRSADEAHALRELDGHPRLDDVRNLIGERLEDGIVEIKGAWVARDLPRRGLSDAWARCHVHALDWFDARYAMCTASETVAPRWSSSGGRAMPDLLPVPYPDDRYRTVLLWWDREVLEGFATATQWRRVAAERVELRRRLGGRAEVDAWQAELLDERVPVDAFRLHELRQDPTVTVVDRLDDQLAALAKVRPAVLPMAGDDTTWAFYPWRRTLVRVLGERSFRALRLDRNRNKITAEEQERLGRLKIGVVGLSVGHTIAYVLALEGICGELRLADFDTIELSNLNRIPATVLDLGLNKAVVVGRRIAELDPYVRLDIRPDGLDAETVTGFVRGLDVVVEECDSLDVKALVRDAARRLQVPVLMETSDRGLLDVERYDLEPDRPIFHGLLGDVAPTELVGLTTHDKVPHVLRILEPDQLSSRMAASMAEIDETLTTWPQLGGDVTLGGATIAAAVRRLGLGRPLPSGRMRVDLDATLDGLVEPELPVEREWVPIVEPTPPADEVLAVAHAATLAPSGGNSQPWTIYVDDRRFRIGLDPSRTSTMDVRFRGSYVAIGAALHNARVAAAARGVLGEVTLLPEGGAELAFGTGTDPELAAAYPLVLHRATNRRAGVPAPVEPTVAEGLAVEVALEGGALHLLSDPAELDTYADLLGESDRLRYLSPRLHAELMSELRWPGDPSPETGIDVRTLELDAADLAKLAVARRADVMADLAAWDGGRALGETTRERVRSSSAIAVVTMQGRAPSDYVRGGAAVQRLWLAAEAAGLAVQPVSPLSVFAVDDEDFEALVPGPYVPRLQALHRRIRALAGLGAEEAIALVVRLSHGAGTPVRSLRLPLEATLLGGRAPT